MKISDRDKKLILGILLIAIIALPIVFFIKPTNEKIKGMDDELVQLNERYNYLKDLYDKKSTYEARIVELNQERDELIQLFAGGIKFENTIMFLRGVELSDNPVRSTVIEFTEDVLTPITDASVDENGDYVEGLTAVRSSAVINYCGEYRDVIEFINYIFNQDEKMTLSSFSMELDQTTNMIKGSFILDQYAITGNGKEVPEAQIPDMLHGTNRLFDLLKDDEGNILSYWSSIGVDDPNGTTTNSDENQEN